MAKSIAKLQTSIFLKLPSYLVLIYQGKAKAHHTSMTFEIKQALIRDMEAEVEMSTEGIEEESIERFEQSILDCIQQLISKGTDPTIREVARYRTRFTKKQVTDTMMYLVTQGRLERYKTGKTYRFTLHQ